MTSLALPPHFVYLSDVDPTIIQEIRYAGSHNVLGRPVAGYEKPVCIVTDGTAKALRNIQRRLRPMGLSLKVYDCYRPKMAVQDFLTWSKNAYDEQMKAEFFPRIAKSNLFRLGYIAYFSGHSRGSTVDLTVVNTQKPVKPARQQQQAPCYAPWAKRIFDTGLDMGCGYDCLDQAAHFDYPRINLKARANRQFLRRIMIENGFVPYDKEWWHFTLQSEPYPNAYFNFKVQ